MNIEGVDPFFYPVMNKLRASRIGAVQAGAFIAEDESVGWGIGTPASVGLIPETILLDAGFTVVADHDVLPRLQMTLPPPQGLLAVEEAEELIRQALTAVQT